MNSELNTVLVLAKNVLNTNEYASFVDLLTSIDTRASKLLAINNKPNNNDTNDLKNIKYPYDLTIDITLTTYKNNQIGQRLEIIDTINQSFLKKINIGQDPQPAIKDLINLINQYCVQ